MKILLIGSGGREHAIAMALARSPKITRLYALPGNPGIGEYAQCHTIDIDDHDHIVSFCRKQSIDLVVIGPEAPLVSGLCDTLGAAGISAFGPSRAAARLEGSKLFMKEICRQARVPTAEFCHFSDAGEAFSYLETASYPVVVKADGLAAGKGVTIAPDKLSAIRAVEECFEGKFGAAGNTILIEEYLTGPEVSFFAISDGTHVLPLSTACDHKRAFDGDQGPNTGGMGAYSPAPMIDSHMSELIMEQIIKPPLATLREQNMPFLGILFAGLMITDSGPKLLEFNVRFGDPECQAILMRLEDDFLALLLSAVEGNLAGQSLHWRKEVSIAVTMAAKGYPGAYQRGEELVGLPSADASSNSMIFHAGTVLENGRLVTNGGRVLNVAATGNNLAAARKTAYEKIDQIDWPGGFYRSDIGNTAIE